MTTKQTDRQTNRQIDQLRMVPARYLKRLNRRNVAGWEGVNLEQLARDVGVSGQYLRDCLGGKRVGSVKLMEQVADRLGWEFMELVRWVRRAERVGGRVGASEVLKRGAQLRGIRDIRGMR